MRFLSNSEYSQLARSAAAIADGGSSNQSGKPGALFYPKLAEEAGISPKTWSEMPKSGRHFCIFLAICSDIHCKHGGYEKLMNKAPKSGMSGLGRAIWTSDLAVSNKRFASKYGWQVMNTYSGAGDPALSKDIYMFQHYAEFSELGEANPTVANPNVKMDDRISGSSTAQAYNRDGILGPRTMGQLVAMVNSDYTKVSTNAVNIAPAGAALARKLANALSWPALNMAKDNPDNSLIPTASEAIPCTDISDAMLLAPGSENNPAYSHCLDRIRQLRAGSGGGGGSASASNSLPFMIPGWSILDALKKPLPGIPGIDLSKTAANLKNLIPAKPKPGSESDFEKTPFDEPEPDAIAETDSSQVSPIPGNTIPESGTQTETVRTTSSLFTTADGKLTPLAIGLGLVGAAGLAWWLLSGSGDKLEYNEFGQPLQAYDENGLPIIEVNSNGQPLQCYDMQGRPVALSNRFGQPLQTYTEDGKAVGRSNPDGSPMVLFDLEGNIVYVNQVANVSVNQASNKAMNQAMINSNAYRNYR